ncbi:MAG: hypothetical protein ACREOZ_04885 [Gloeomargaritales cyanobacterium]
MRTTMCHVRWRKTFQYHFGRTKIHATLVELQHENCPGVPFKMPSVEEQEFYPMFLDGPSGSSTAQAQYRRIQLILKEERLGHPVVEGQELCESDGGELDFIGALEVEQPSDCAEDLRMQDQTRSMWMDYNKQWY